MVSDGLHWNRPPDLRAALHGWILRCFAPPAAGARGSNAPNLAFFGELDKSKTLLLNRQDHDVFGDGAVVIKFTPGHTPGHQALFLKLAKTGPVVLTGDLYHYPEEMKLKVIPSFDFNKEQTAKSREMLEAFAKGAGAQIWIQHDATASAKLKKSPRVLRLRLLLGCGR
jgi:N-acyl homoserine lactone hydrolase